MCRFSFELVESIVKKAGGEIIVIGNNQENLTSEQELSQDIISIIHVYSCRQMGKRKYKSIKSTESEDLSNNATKTEIK